jgi:DNA-binding CsgD family transcriptional regulator
LVLGCLIYPNEQVELQLGFAALTVMTHLRIVLIKLDVRGEVEPGRVVATRYTRLV